MEPYPGVFVSTSSAEAWEPDPEVGGEMHVLCDGYGIQSGLSRFTEVTEPGQVDPARQGDASDPGRRGEKRDRRRAGAGADGGRYRLAASWRPYDLVSNDTV